MLRHIIAIISCFLALTANAQSGNFLDNLRKNEAGKAKVTVTQSMAIDILVNGKGGLKALRNIPYRLMPKKEKSHSIAIPIKKTVSWRLIAATLKIHIMKRLTQMRNQSQWIPEKK